MTQPNAAAAVDQTAEPLALADLVDRARKLAARGRRALLGITGSPGAGKSTVCAALLDALGDEAVLVGMDGFHFANTELVRLARRDRKGAPDTFDVDGYVALLGRLRTQTADVIYAPRFDRGLEESIGSAVPVYRETPLVITEGNYLLLDSGGWEQVRGHLDEVWFLDVPADRRVNRLVARRQSFGEPAELAASWVHGVDQANADYVEANRNRADLLIDFTTHLGTAPTAAVAPPDDRARPAGPSQSQTTPTPKEQR